MTGTMMPKDFGPVKTGNREIRDPVRRMPSMYSRPEVDRGSREIE
jgi:hypothetical protein